MKLNCINKKKGIKPTFNYHSKLVKSSQTLISSGMSKNDSYVSELCLHAMHVTRERNHPPKIRWGMVVVSSYLSSFPYKVTFLAEIS